jgi:hypothetical protein
MTLKEIRYYNAIGEHNFKFKEVSDIEWLDIIRTSCPWLKYDAKLQAAKCIGIAPSMLDKDKVRKFLLHNKEYDAIEIGRLITEVQVRSENNE